MEGAQRPPTRGPVWGEKTSDSGAFSSDVMSVYFAPVVVFSEGVGDPIHCHQSPEMCNFRGEVGRGDGPESGRAQVRRGSRRSPVL